MAYLYRKHRSPHWYIQYLDSERNKHDESTGLRADDPNDTIKAKILRVELEAKEYQRAPLVNGSAWDASVPKFLERHCQSKATFDRYEDAWKWVALWFNVSGFMPRDNAPANSELSMWTGVPISKSAQAKLLAEILPSSN